jgi:hypothetical protein
MVSTLASYLVSMSRYFQPRVLHLNESRHDPGPAPAQVGDNIVAESQS